jgi:hypothetical protein
LTWASHLIKIKSTPGLIVTKTVNFIACQKPKLKFFDIQRTSVDFWRHG